MCFGIEMRFEIGVAQHINKFRCLAEILDRANFEISLVEMLKFKRLATLIRE